MDTKNLVTFIHVAELSSFTRAAQALGYAQSTVSFQIRQLEEELGVQLFERINHTVTLTKRGRDVLAYAHQISKTVKELGNAARAEGGVSGHVRLAMADSLCEPLLGDRFVDFRRRFPGVTLQVITAGTQEMFRLLNHNEVDAILTLDSHIFNTDYVIVREEQVQAHFVAAAGHPLCARERVPLRELVREPFILTEQGMSYRRIMDERLAALSLEIKPILEIGGTSLIASLVAQGAGLSFLPDYVTRAAVEEGSMARLRVPQCEVVVWKQLLYHRDKWMSSQLESTLQYCAQSEFAGTGGKRGEGEAG